MQFTKHAKARWNERFGNLCPDYEFSTAKKPKKVDLINIKKQCPKHVNIMNNKSQYGLMYKITPNGVVFVCNSDEVIITVFPYILTPPPGSSQQREPVYLKGRPVRHIRSKNRW